MTSISVLMPVYNAGPYLEGALGSLIPELRDGDELIVQDALSDDGSSQILARWASLDRRIRVFREADQGQADGLNMALRQSNNPYILWMNADDLVRSGGLGAMRDSLDSAPKPPDILVAAWEIVDANGAQLRYFEGRRLVRKQLFTKGCYQFSGSMLVRREVVNNCGGWNPCLHYCMDLGWMMKLAEGCGNQIVVPHPVGVFRWHDESKSGSQGFRFVREGFRVRLMTANSLNERFLTVTAAMTQALALALLPWRYGARWTQYRSAYANSRP